MEMTRRDALVAGAGALVATALPFQAFAASHGAMSEAEKMFTGGAAADMDGVTLTAPEIAENGNTVPVSVDAPGAVAIILIAEGNPEPKTAEVAFGPMAGAQNISMRIRLAGSQNVTAIAKMADGSFKKASSAIKVTIGGCGG
jgi:sulfur-oxidizing protein SoxY